MRFFYCALWVWCTVLLPTPAWSHAHLVGSEPPANALIENVPTQLRLRFSEPVETTFAKVRITADKQTLTLSPGQLQWDSGGKNLQIQMPAHEPATQYGVEWSLLAKDGHAGKGRLSFKVKPK